MKLELGTPLRRNVWYEVSMKIRTKIISLLALLFAVLIVLEVAVQRHVLMPSFAQLEREAANTSMKRIDFALNATLDGLQLSAADWGNWSDLYRFVQTPSAEFIAANITPVAMKQLQVNAFLIVDRTGRVVLSRAQTLDSGAGLDLDLTEADAMPANFPWRRNLADGHAAQGLLRTNLGIIMLAAAPILDGSGGGRSLGLVILGTLLTPAQVARIGAQAQAHLSVPGGSVPGAGPAAAENDGTTRVDRTFSDIYGAPVLTLRVEAPRVISKRGQQAVTYAAAYLIGVGATALVLLLVVLNRLVLGPLARVTQHAVSIGAGSDLTARLNLPGRDEVAVLAQEFDRMVESVAESRRLLVDQSYRAGFAELARGVLHNLGNAMTPLAVRVSSLSDRLGAAPIADLDLAITELASARPGSARYKDLEQFLRLGCRKLCRAAGDAQADVAVIQRQTVIVQTALAELMNSTHDAPVIESVRLPELIVQTLEIVPDVFRQRLAVESDDSLRRVGAVRVARTVLRLVLQNLIINAADAARAAGRERGVFRVAADIVLEADRSQLHLRCEDDGVGIAREDLERVFDQGFTTKAQAHNHGIGLHWSANAIAALGGRIWAASDGPGLGAALHLMIPL